MPRWEPTITSRAVHKLLASLPDPTLEPAALCREVGLDRAVCDDPEARVPLATLHALWERALARVDRPDAALAVAERYVPGDYALLGFVCMSAATLGDALRQVARYLALWTDEPVASLEESGAVRLTYTAQLADRPGLRLATEAFFAEVLHTARQLLQLRLVPAAVAFAHPAPSSTAAHDAFFGTPVAWRQARAELRFTREQLALPLPRVDPQLGAFLRGLANDALARHAARDSVHGALRRVIADALQQGVPTLDELARRMKVSARTLRRRLESEGTSFRDLLDATRADLARAYVSQPTMPLGEVAFLLGFSEPSAFHRAFKRWTGETPARFRARGVA